MLFSAVLTHTGAKTGSPYGVARWCHDGRRRGGIHGEHMAHGRGMDVPGSVGWASSSVVRAWRAIPNEAGACPSYRRRYRATFRFVLGGGGSGDFAVDTDRRRPACGNSKRTGQDRAAGIGSHGSR